MKRQYFLEIKDSKSICGGCYSIGEKTEKQALNQCVKDLKNLWKQDKERHYHIGAYLCTDDECLNVSYSIDLYHGDIRITEWETLNVIRDDSHARLTKLLND